jgi:hypothetical protein
MAMFLIAVHAERGALVSAVPGDHPTAFMKFLTDLPRDTWLVQVDYYS